MIKALRMALLLLCITAYTLAPADVKYVLVYLSKNSDCSTVDLITLTTDSRLATASVCLTSPQPICGITYTLTSTPNDTGTVQITSRTSPLIVDVTQPQTVPFSLGPPVTYSDLGFVTVDRIPILGGERKLLATYGMSLVKGAAGMTYLVQLNKPFSYVLFGKDSNCWLESIADYVDVPLDGLLPAPQLAGIKK